MLAGSGSLLECVLSEVVFYRVFANETSQFLAPYEASVKARGSSSSPTEAGGNSQSSLSAGAAPPANADLNIPEQKSHVGVSASHVSRIMGQTRRPQFKS